MKRDPDWAGYHYVRKDYSRTERRAAIEKGFRDFQHQGLAADPPYSDGDPRRWLWQNGWEQADLVHQGRATGIEGAREWT